MRIKWKKSFDDMDRREKIVANIVKADPKLAGDNTGMLIATWEYLLQRPIDNDLKKIMYMAKAATLLRIKCEILPPSSEQRKLQAEAIYTRGENIRLC
tara:strand:- start:19934 stop:20227 length:294 start_codon:yes stop_codon:yes gene_type:complete